MASVVFEQNTRIPLGLSSLEQFRAWARSDDFPENGRIDYIDGDVEVDMSPEDLFTHGTLKTKLTAVLLERVERLDLGHLFSDCARISDIEANLSVEPDVVLISHEAIKTGRVTLVPKAGGLPDRFIEIEGTPELIVEIISDSSVIKDRQRLLAAYHAAGVPEYWLVDARGSQLSFQLHALDANQYRLADIDADGYQRSAVLACYYQLRREQGKHGYWQYDLEAKPQ
ncbi:MAG: Uma2 family endonuclease [Planctomycetes bacterium]|nr:Uma2 family endonuclease [Planctomycetota bacterium]